MKRLRGLITILTNDRPWLAPVVFGAFLRIVNLGQESLWYDESYTLWICKLPFDKMMGAIVGDVHPPLFYWIEWANIRFLGESEFALRLPSAIFGIISICLVYRLALNCHQDRGAAIASGFVAALLPGLLYYSQESRMYSLLVLFVLLAVNCAIENNKAGFALASVGAIYTQNLGVLFVGTIGLVWWIREFRAYLIGLLDLPGNYHGARDLTRLTWAGALILIAWIPWLPFLLHQLNQIDKGYWIQPVNIGAILLPIPVIGWGWRLPDALQIDVYSLAFASLLVGLAVSRSWLQSPGGRLLLAGSLFAPALAAMYSATHQSIYLPRAMLPAIAMMIPILAYPLVKMTRPNKRIALLVFIPCLVGGAFYHYFPAIGGRFPAREWAATINQGWTPGDVTYHMGIDTAMIFRPYLAHSDYAVLPHFSDLNQALTEETKSHMGFNQVPFDSLAGLGYKRAWLVVTENRITNTTQMSEVNRVLAQYPHSTARDIDDGYLNETIYLVLLIRSPGL